MIPLTILNALLTVVLLWVVFRLRLEMKRRGSEFLERHADLEAALNAQRASAVRLEEASRQIKDAQSAATARADRAERGTSEFAERISAEIASSGGDLAGRLESVTGDLAGRFESVSGDLAGRVESVSGDLTGRLASLSGDLASLASAQNEQTTALRTDAEALAGQAVQAVSGLGSRVDRLSDDLRSLGSSQQEEIARLRSVLVPSIDAPFQDPIPHIQEASPSQVLEIASQLHVLRPLVPYPHWHFDADWRNPEMALRVRRSVWTYFNQRKLAAPLDVCWHHGTKVRIYLGNDLSRQLFIAGCIDPNEFVLLDKVLQTGMTFLDVGANEGLYSLFASARVGPSGSVWAFEPSQREIARIDCNLELNRLNNVHRLPIALSSSDGDGTLLVAGYEHEGHNTLGAFIYDTVLQHEETVPLRRLDRVVEESKVSRVDFIKIDVEGAELKVLTGARKTLQQFRPFVLFEANNRSLQQQGADVRELIHFLTSESFQIYLFDSNTGCPAVAREGCFSENMLAVPEERALPESVFLAAPAAPHMPPPTHRAPSGEFSCG